jgi:hypothetical protein
VRDLSSKISFVTASLATRWESYSQTLLQASFPECKRVVIDGSRNWDPLFFVEVARRLTTEHVVLVDEDCFLFERDQLVALLDLLESEPGTAVVATPDGGTFHRDYNPVACNPFFAIVNRAALLAATSAADWRQLQYSDVEAIANADHVALLDRSRMKYELSEPYYPFFWAILRSGFKIRYLLPDLNKELLASELNIDGAARPLLIHMWWLRKWDVTTVEPYLSVSHRGRYALLQAKYLAPFLAARSARGKFLWLNLGRLCRVTAARVRMLATRPRPKLLGQET